MLRPVASDGGDWLGTRGIVTGQIGWKTGGLTLVILKKHHPGRPRNAIVRARPFCVDARAFPVDPTVEILSVTFQAWRDSYGADGRRNLAGFFQ